jgi:hypothetical protein
MYVRSLTVTVTGCLLKHELQNLKVGAFFLLRLSGNEAPCVYAFKLCVYGGGLIFRNRLSFGSWSRTLSLPRDPENGNLSRNAHTAQAM